MNLLILKPGVQTVEYTSWSAVDALIHTGTIDFPDFEAEMEALQEKRTTGVPGIFPDALAMRVHHGGREFGGPVCVTSDVVARLETMVPQAPMHLPVVLSLVQICRRLFPALPLVLLFETSFFVQLPHRESTYGIDSDLSLALGLRRYGYHGLFHEAACVSAARERKREEPARLLSICLEPHPEIAAVMGSRPVLCTSGATPLEGIFGHTSCGEIDPSIVLNLARKKGWGPEQINTVLTQQSGLLGLTGSPARFDALFADHADDIGLARAVFQNQILTACGAGMAAMGGVDTIVFSGQFEHLGYVLGPWLKDRLTFRGGNEKHPPAWVCFTDSLDRVIAARTEILLLKAARSASV